MTSILQEGTFCVDGIRAASFSMEGLSVIICIILLAQLCVVKQKRSTDRWLKLALLSNIGMLLGDMTDWGLSGSGLPGANLILLIGMTLFFICSGFVMLCFFAYVYTYFDRKRPQSKLLFRIVFVLALVEVAIAIITPFTGLSFVITPEGVYERGPLFLLTQVPSALAYLCVLIMYVRGWKDLTVKEKCYFTLYLVIPIVAEIIQVTTYSIALLPVALTITFLLVYTFINFEMDEQVRESNRKAEEERFKRLQAMQQSQAELTREITTALGNAIEAKDPYTNGHAQRVAQYAREIALRLGWDEEEQDKAYYAGMLHDVGKIKVTDAIINKPSDLTSEEYEEIKLHTITGYHILREIKSARDFAIGARWHHERWDGHGYPDGLKGERIPVIARIICVADAYDAMTSNRSYNTMMTQAEVRTQISKGANRQFDPRITAIMLQMIDEDDGFAMRENPDISQDTARMIDND